MSGVPPTRMNQQVFKGKKKAAESGHKLLKKKADALKVRWMMQSRSAEGTKSGIDTFQPWPSHDVFICQMQIHSYCMDGVECVGETITCSQDLLLAQVFVIFR